MGNIQASLKSAFPAKSQYTHADIPDQTGKVILVTGGNTGIGFETCRVLLSKGAKVYLAARSQDKARGAIERLKASTGREAEFLQLDLADLPQIKRAAQKFMQREKELHVLFLSAGVMYPDPGSTTSQGYELQFGVNTLGSHAFASALLPILRSTAKSSPKGTVRVVTTASSAAHFLAPKSGIELNKVQDKKYIQNSSMMNRYTKYGCSKFGNVLFANELAKRYGDEGIISLSLDPGNINSDLWRNQGFFSKTIGRFVLHPVEDGAITQLYGGTSPDITTADGGVFLEPWARKSACRHPRAHDEALAREQWEWCEKQMQIHQQ